MKVTVKIEGVEDVIASLKRVGEAGEKAMLRVAGACTARVVPQAQAITPVEEEDGGALRDSVRATKPTKTSAGRVSAGVVAGGAPLRRLASERGRALPGQYGSIVHEDLTLRHAHGEPKFVEKPFFREVPKVPGELEIALDNLTAAEGV